MRYRAIISSGATAAGRRRTDSYTAYTTDGQPLRPDGSNAVPILLPDSDALVVPTVGFIVEF